jgi:hypothetical protein
MEVQVLHAHGKMQLCNVACEKEDSAMRQEKDKKTGGKDKARKEEVRAAEPQPQILINSTYISGKTTSLVR